ncbi:hypothetical protein K2F40_10200 [Clostridium sp. CM028]|uniref:hypothetical protein n=1 Tax=unclassified Clostridium TaxID=2614128 RepID=UPI001C6F138B|nr:MULTISPECIES: hypothetical protein [unclassified Clostridium]MBW9144432.1 hypothetical protein [Clostridium sp. CM027]MBW9149332.1 hypothetical protein [Clostridium sp. CM028]UVE40943.1 hypothetical protein KTC92_00065 [Clostridium sp. CM027]WLC61611.1 hypothetical protein KTC94_16370 [Clostridium sp. CM028]
MSSFSKREKLLVIVGTILVILYPYYNLFLKPISQKIKIVNQSISDKKIECDSIEKFNGSNISNTEKLEDIKNIYNESVKVLPENERNPEISYSINTFAAKNKIKLISVAFGQSVNYSSKNSVNNSANITANANEVDSSIDSTNHKLMFVPVTVIINGDYSSVLSFISDIEGDSRLAEIVDISMSSTQGESKGTQATIVLNYYSTEGTIKNKPSYDFKDDNVGKSNLFN